MRLGWVLSVLTSPCRVSNPNLILKRRFCSAEMCVMRRFSVLGDLFLLTGFNPEPSFKGVLGNVFLGFPL